MHDSWQNSGPSIRRLKPFLFIFRPDVFPNILKYTTYPVNVAQKQLFNHLRTLPTPRHPSENPAAMRYYWTEEIALFDRCTAVAYTGSMKVVPKKLGTIFWFGLAVHAGLMPTFNPAILQVPDEDDDNVSAFLKVIPSQWPVDAKTSRPLQASTRTHQIEYKERFAEVRQFGLQLFNASCNTFRPFYAEGVIPLSDILYFLTSIYLFPFKTHHMSHPPIVSDNIPPRVIPTFHTRNAAIIPRRTLSLIPTRGIQR
jgi:hypothetical protein